MSRQTHYLRPNETTRIPRRHVILATAPIVSEQTWGHEHAWGSAAIRTFTTLRDHTNSSHDHAFVDADALWNAVSQWTRKRERTVLWGHNLGYSTRIGDAFTHLPALGWDLVAHNMSPRGTWLTWRRDGATLVMVDIASIWPTTLAGIGKMFDNFVNYRFEDEDANSHVSAQCAHNIDRIFTAVTKYLHWLEDADMGNWQLTGAGQSWAAFRHKYLTHRMLVHDDETVLATEREAMWTGRCEAYWHGSLLREVIHEWDFPAAYADIAANTNVPVRLLGAMPKGHDWADTIHSERTGLLARVHVDIEVPSVPCRHDGRICWPVGSFDTTLWDCEIKQAIEDGAKISVLEGYLYHKAPALVQWAKWILFNLNADDVTVPAWRKAIFKHWSRALIGRFAMKYPTWDEFARMAEPTVDRRTMIDEIDNCVYDVMQVGHKIMAESGMSEWEQSMPAITGYIMAQSRVRLWRIVRALPERTALYVDTDSILVHDSAHGTVARVAAGPEGHGLRLKRSWDGVQIFGPRQIVTGPKVRMAGIPIAAARTGRVDFEGEVYEGLAVAIGAGNQSTVRAMSRTWHAQGQDRRRVSSGFGWTEPIRIGG